MDFFDSFNKLYLQFLYKWIAIETIAKVNHDEDIIPKLCLVLGFPLSKHSRSIPKQKMKELITIKNYRHYRDIIRDNFYECRIIRNEIVHSGFKETNLLDKNMELKLYLINSAYNCVMRNFEKIMFTGKNSLKEIWDEMVEYVLKDEHLLKWISGTFLKQINNIYSGRRE